MTIKKRDLIDAYSKLRMNPHYNDEFENYRMWEGVEEVLKAVGIQIEFQDLPHYREDNGELKQ